MFSLRVSMVFLLATLALTLATPQVPVMGVMGYNCTQEYTLTSEQIPTLGYMTDMVYKRHEDGDERVVFEHIRKNLVLPGTRNSLTSTYFQFREKTKITALEVTNVNPKNGGKAFIVAGGVGKDFVTLKFLSELNNSLEYDVSIWCK